MCSDPSWPCSPQHTPADSSSSSVLATACTAVTQTAKALVIQLRARQWLPKLLLLLPLLLMADASVAAPVTVLLLLLPAHLQPFACGASCGSGC
jgi:hypothetical protein